MKENCESIGNYVWIVDTHGGGQRKLIAKNYAIDGHGNLLFTAYLPCGCVMNTHTFAPGTWVNVSLFQPELITIENVLGS